MGHAIRGCAALLLLATSAIAEAVTYASIEAQHAATAATLQPSPDAGRALGQIGVARVDGVVDASRCAALRTRIYDLLATLDDDDGPRDRRFVAGTRLRLGDAMRATCDAPLNPESPPRGGAAEANPARPRASARGRKASPGKRGRDEG